MKPEIKWAKDIVDILIAGEITQDYLDMWRDDKTYVYEFHKKHVNKARGIIHKGIVKAENAANDVLNIYYTQLVRDELIKRQKKQ